MLIDQLRDKKVGGILERTTSVDEYGGLSGFWIGFCG